MSGLLGTISEAVLEFGVEEFQNFSDPGVAGLVGVGLETLDYAWDEGEKAFTDVIEAVAKASAEEARQEAASRYAEKLAAAIAELHKELDAKVEELQLERDAAILKSAEAVRAVEDRYKKELDRMLLLIDRQDQAIQILRKRIAEQG